LHAPTKKTARFTEKKIAMAILHVLLKEMVKNLRYKKVITRSQIQVKCFKSDALYHYGGEEALI
jgi:hypothetical protein